MFTATVQVGDWSAVFVAGEDADEQLVADNGTVLDGLTAGWSMDGFPGTPTPVTVSLGLYVPAAAGNPPPIQQGAPIRVTITPPGFDPADPDYGDPVLGFRGRIDSADAEPMRDGLAYAVAATDYTAALNERGIGLAEWPAESWPDRWFRIYTSASGPGLEFEMYVPYDDVIYEKGFGPFNVRTRPPGATSVAEFIDSHFRVTGYWLNSTESPAHDSLVPYLRAVGPFHIPPRRHWFRPFMVQRFDDATGAHTLTHGWQTIGVAGAGACPLRFTVEGDRLTTVAAPELGVFPPDNRRSAWIPADAIDRGVVWRQDKRTTVNRVRVNGEFQSLDAPLGEGPHLAYAEAEWPALARENGPVEEVIETDVIDIIGDPEGPAPGHGAGWLGPMLLGSMYDGSPRYTADELSVAPHLIPDGRQWPRFFPEVSPNPPAGWDEPDNWYEFYAGKFVFIYGIKPEWSPTRRSTWFGQLTGANLTVSGGRLQITAQLAHRLPVPVSGDIDHDSPNSDAAGPGHNITHAQFAAAFPTITSADVDPAVTNVDALLTHAP